MKTISLHVCRHCYNIRTWHLRNIPDSAKPQFLFTRFDNEQEVAKHERFCENNPKYHLGDVPLWVRKFPAEYKKQNEMTWQADITKALKVKYTEFYHRLSIIAWVIVSFGVYFSLVRTLLGISG